MSEVIITAVIAAIASVVGSYFTNQRHHREDDIKREVEHATTNTRLDNIERKLDTHNKYAEKIGSIKTDIARIKKDIDYLKANNA